MSEILRTIYQIMLILTITFVAAVLPDHISILIALCTWYIVSVIREGKENRWMI